MKLLNKLSLFFKKKSHFIQNAIYISEEEAFHILDKKELEQNNKHYFEVYSQTLDQDYRDMITKYKKNEFDRNRNFTFHGHCHNCPAQKRDFRFCMICEFYPSNEKYIWGNSNYDMYNNFESFESIFELKN